jgi:hypothetical protein
MPIPYTPENRAKILEVADTLLGTCKGLDDVLQEVFGDEDLTMYEVDTLLLQELDDSTMECAACGWWCETGELDDDQICDDCNK